jgi:multidrug efflux pump
VVFVPVFFVVIRSIFKGSERQRRKYAHEDGSVPVVEQFEKKT